MNFYQYKGLKVEVIRHYKVAGKRYVDFRALSNGEIFKGVPHSLVKEANKVSVKKTHKHISEKIPTKKGEAIPEKIEDVIEEVKNTRELNEVKFKKNGKVVAQIACPSKDYDEFVKNNKLNPVMVQNCIKGNQKSHKGFQITFSK